MMVLFYHFIYVVRLDAFHSVILSNAYLFVDFFFTLSGFVVCHAYRDRLGDGAQLGGFLLRRIGRLWPLHLAILFVFMLAIMLVNLGGWYPDSLRIAAEGGSYSLKALLLNAMLLNSMGLYGSAWNGPAWSIGAEFYTYVLFALVVVAFGRARLVWLSLMLVALAMVVLVYFAPGHMNSTADFGFIRCIAGFFTGVAAQRLHRRLRGHELSGATAWEIAAVGVTGLFIAVAGLGPDAVRPVSVLAPVVFAGAILIFARDAGGVSALLHAAPFRALGAWSYSIYLLHMPLLILVGYGLWIACEAAGVPLRAPVDVLGHTKQLYDLGSPWLAGALLVAFAALVLCLARLSYHLVEVPWRDRFGYLARARETGGRAYLPFRSGSAMAPVRAVDRRR